MREPSTPQSKHHAPTRETLVLRSGFLVSLSPTPTPSESISMPIPTAVPADAATQLPKARMIDPRGHRFGAGVSAILLVVAFLTGTVWLVALGLLSIGVSAAFGLKYSIYGVVWRRIAKVLALPKVEPEHE